MGQHIRTQLPDFDPRTGGSVKTSDLLREIGLFTRETKEGGGAVRVRAGAK